MTNATTTDILDMSSAAKDRLESQIHRQLLDKIRFGTYALGERLPSEHELCEEHGVSRPVVRAALSKLRDSGLIVSRQGAGSFVSSGAPVDQGGYSPLSSISDISSYFAFRRIIETESVDLATRRATPKDLAQLRGIVDDMRALLQKGEAAVSVDIQLHATIAELSGSRFLIETVDMLRPHWIFVGNFVRSLGITGGRTGKRMTDEHTAIIDAMQSGDSAHARQVMLNHIDGSENRVFKGEQQVNAEKTAHHGR